MMSISLQSQTINITQQTGWLESAYIKWDPVASADSYNVYYSGNGITDKKIDTQLIRSYGTYFRADVLGLSAGTYTLKVVPVIGGIEGAATSSNPIVVSAQDRTGFAYRGGRLPGGYKADGTLKDNAVVVYITQNTKNTVSMNVTGATTNPCIGLQNILDGFKKGSDSRPLVVRMIGNITDLSNMLAGDIVIENKNNANGSITMEGVGSDAVANGWGIRIKNASNIEVRNIGFMLTDASEGDNVGLQQGNDHIWVHNCDMFYGAAGGDADQVKGDGALDCKKSTDVTFSYNHFWDSGKSNLLGLSEGSVANLYITYHHNWYDHSDSRHPRVRFYSAHIYNNYFDGNSKYGSGSTEASSLFLEGNFFRNCKYPMLTSMQGSDVFNGAPGTFSGEDGGFIKSYNNMMSGQQRFVPYDATNYPVEFDAFVANTRNQIIPNTIKSKQGANPYNNFDTDAALYINSLTTVQEPAAARDQVMLYSGRVSGGDITFAFNNAVDDSSYAINAVLKALLLNYQTQLVFVQGETPVVVSTQTLAIPNNNDQTVAAGVAISNMVYTWGGTADDVTVDGLPASGISFVKNTSAKTVTISGTPTADVNFTVTTSGSSGTPVEGLGNITISTGNPGNPSDKIHNFTSTCADGSCLASTFYTIAGNMNSNSTTPGSITYDGMTLASNLKIESSTNISFTTTNVATLTLVFANGFSGTIKINGTNYTANNGLVVAPNLPIATYTITKGSVANLYYMKTVYTDSLSTIDSSQNNQKLQIYPNPVHDILNIINPGKLNIETITVYSLTGQKVKTISSKTGENINLSSLKAGAYLVQFKTNEGIQSYKIIKK